MFRLLELTKAVKPSMEAQHVREEAHLPESVDVIDLERRMRGFDHRDRDGPQDLGLPPGLR